MTISPSSGRVTLPIEQGIDEQLSQIITALGADAVRNSDGTYLPERVHDLASKVYSTYFPARGEQDFALKHQDTLTCFFLGSARHTAGLQEDDLQLDNSSELLAKPLTIDPMEGYFTEQIHPDTDDLRWWQVFDRTTGKELPRHEWQLVIKKLDDDTDVSESATVGNDEKGEAAAEPGEDKVVTPPSQSVCVVIDKPKSGHVYTVNFLARQHWDTTQMYNYITNDWHNDPTRVKERPYDVRYNVVWEFMKEHLATWLDEHPHVDVVRFTTFFYHFTLLFNDHAKEKFVDWFGYSASVSPQALDAFEAEFGYALTPEDFVDEGYYNCPFRIPSQKFLDWMTFIRNFVTSKARELVQAVHDSGKEAMMFLGDNWIGAEPYSAEFSNIGLDAVVGSVGGGATCRMIADIPDVVTEGRFLPYFFPDVFHEGGDPVAEAEDVWIRARRAIVRNPLDRIGYGGYLSLAMKFPDFMTRIEQICQEFRDIHHYSSSRGADAIGVRVAVLNAWGSLRRWQTEQVAHGIDNAFTRDYYGVLESLSGLPLDIEFVSFDDVIGKGLDSYDVIINAGADGTAFSGGQLWEKSEFQQAIRHFVASGGGFIGVGAPSAAKIEGSGVYFQLADILGVDLERGFGLSTNRYREYADEHFIVENLNKIPDVGRRGSFIIPVSNTTRIIHESDGSVDIAVNSYGKGRCVYMAGLPFSWENSDMLLRAIAWAGQAENQLKQAGYSPDPNIEVAAWGERLFVMNNSHVEVSAKVYHKDFVHNVSIQPSASQWL